jgi:hypothetical protein
MGVSLSSVADASVRLSPETCINSSLRDLNLLLEDEFWVTDMPIKAITYITTGQENVVAFLYY